MPRDDWSAREHTLNRFEAAWATGVGPDLQRFYNEVEPNIRDEELRVELCLIDLEHRLRNGQPARSEDYARIFGDRLHSKEIQKQLVSGEIAVRNYVGPPATSDELLQRFPILKDELELLLAANSDNDSQSQPTHRKSTTFACGQKLGPYQIGDVIGAGAFSVVYSAVDERSGSRVAVKQLQAHVADQGTIRERMLREARAAAGIDHPNIVRVLDVGSCHGTDYVVSRLVEGNTLADTLNSANLTYEQSARLVMQIANGIHEAHQQGIVHRDLKPANVLLDGDIPLITDFGLAHLADATQNLTHEGDLVGTPAYMAPEQAAGRGWLADPRADVYSLGVLLFRLTTGRLPFEGTTSEVLSQVLHREPPAPRRLAADLPIDLETIILKCLEKEPADRYLGADCLATDLETHLAGRSIAARRPGQFSRIMKWSRRRPAVAGSVFSILVLSAFLIGSLLQLGRVGNERDRAVTAESKAVESERDKQYLLASAAADAGILAMQRGHLSRAVAHFDQSLQQGIEDDLPLRLRRIDALLALRRVDEAQTELSLIAKHSERSRHEGEIILWEAELHMESGTEGRVVVERLERALPHLTGADAIYCEGMLAEDSVTALSHFRQAVAADPFHGRARRMVITVLLSLARIEETLIEIEKARNLFPEDAAIPLLESLATARQGRVEEAESIVAMAATSPSEHETWLSFCQAVGAIEFDMGDDESTVNLKSLSEFASKVVLDFRPLMLDRGLRLPPRIAAAFSGLPELLSKKTSLKLPNRLSKFLMGPDPAVDEIQSALEAIAAVHPEMSSMTLLGYIHLMKRELDASRDRLEEALRHRSWIPKVEQGARLNLCTVAIIRALVDQNESKKNLCVLVQASEGLDPAYVETSKAYRAIVIGLLSAREYDKAAPFVDAWLQCDDCDLLDCLWNKALIEEHREDWLAVVATADRILENGEALDRSATVQRQQLIDLRNHAKVEIGKIVSKTEDGKSSRNDAESKPQDLRSTD